MANKTNIEWTDFNWNFIRGCSRVSEGCRHCYAETVAHRFGGPGQPYEGLTVISSDGDPRWNGKITFHEDILTKPLHWKKPRKIFVNSMSDLFHENVSFEIIDKAFAVMALTPHHTYQILTKRPERMREYLKNKEREGIIMQIVKDMLISDPSLVKKFTTFFYQKVLDEMKFPNGIWPPSNIWLGVSIENQKTYNERLPILLDTPAIVRWVSIEPLLGRINDLKGMEKLAWVVVGGESGHGARPIHPDWVRKIRNLCVLTSVPFFFKQWGTWQPFSTTDGRQIAPLGNYGTVPENHHGRIFYPNFIKAGKKRAGRLLDGKEYSEFPEVRESKTFGLCQFCGCTDMYACNPPCYWIDNSHTICSSKSCVRKAKKEVTA